MSTTVFDRDDFKKEVPEEVILRTKENMEVYNMDLNDSFQEAARTLAPKGTDLWKAWYYDDFREYIPCAYQEKYLDFDVYPLKYKTSADIPNKEKEISNMTVNKVLENLKALIGKKMDYDEVICAFEDFEENRETEVFVGKSNNSSYDFIAYINTNNSKQFLFVVNDNNIITDVWLSDGE